jgi:D-methionine transport system ATP-binding protein
MDVIKSICSRVAVMSRGEVVEIGDAYDIFAHPVHDVTRQLVRGSLNLELPDHITGLIDGTLVKVIYRGKSALDPVLADAIRSFPVRINILHGRIDYIAGFPLGILLINIAGENKTDVDNTIRYFRERTADTEVLNG